jgi:hypothetical protein
MGLASSKILGERAIGKKYGLEEVGHTDAVIKAKTPIKDLEGNITGYRDTEIAPIKTSLGKEIKNRLPFTKEDTSIKESFVKEHNNNIDKQKELPITIDDLKTNKGYKFEPIPVEANNSGYQIRQNLTLDPIKNYGKKMAERYKLANVSKPEVSKPEVSKIVEEKATTDELLKKVNSISGDELGRSTKKFMPKAI